MSKEELDRKISEFRDFLEKNNFPVVNLIFENFLSGKIKNKFLDLVKLSKKVDTSKQENEIKFDLIKLLDRIVRLDPTRIKKYYLWDIAVEEKTDFVFEKFTEVKELLDEDGLIQIPYNSDLNKNGFRYKDSYLIFENAYSRNFHLTQWLIENWKNNFVLKLPINKNCLGVSETRRQVELLSHWQGPKTINQIKESLAGKEFVVKGPSFFDAPLMDKTEFLFNSRDNKWHLQIEELLPLDGIELGTIINYQDKEHKFYTRYLHAITNKNLSECFHMDGGIRVYKTYENFERRNKSELKDSSITSYSDRYKFFRVDSESGISSFQEIIGLFFIANPYVLEFFDGESNFTKDLEKNRTGILEIDFKYKKFN